MWIISQKRREDQGGALIVQGRVARVVDGDCSSYVSNLFGGMLTHL